MTRSMKIALAAAAALLLAGCSATHVGESWQCPLAQGAHCASVAAADPAVPAETAKDRTAAAPVLPTPLYRPRGAEDSAPGSDASPPCEADCGFDPFAWLSGLFARIGGEEAAEAESDAAAPAGTDAPKGHGPAMAEGPDDPVVGAVAAPDTAGSAPSVQVVPDTSSEPPPAPAAAATPPATPPAAAPLPAEPTVPDTALRESEVIGRIWIAPFVDADGHYREGSWVRVVLAPAAWRLP